MQSISRAALSKAALRLGTATALAASLASPIAAAPPPPGENPYTLDHFRCYDLWDPDIMFVEPHVTLQDEFDERRQIEEDVSIVGPNRFCAPVVKRVVDHGGNVHETPISDPDAHLTLYAFQEKTLHRPVTWNVVVKNQFGTQKILAKQPRYLAVPTEKVERGLEFPDRLDHFKCYEAYGKDIGLQVHLKDQFAEVDQVVLDPKLYCNPVRKTDSAGTEFGVRSPQLHLTCYDLMDVVPYPDNVYLSIVSRAIRNQFTSETAASTVGFFTVVFDLLCVPSYTVSASPVSGTLGPADVTSD